MLFIVLLGTRMREWRERATETLSLLFASSRLWIWRLALCLLLGIGRARTKEAGYCIIVLDLRWLGYSTIGSKNNNLLHPAAN